MLRSILLGVLTVSAMTACTSKDPAPAVQAGASAGKVVELSGTVMAKRGSESRNLAAGHEISGDDVIETGAESRVSIVLAHNNATWSLGPNKRGKVSESMAWSLAKVDKPAPAADEVTSAAGRHAEKAGANSAATAMDKGADMQVKGDEAPAPAGVKLESNNAEPPPQAPPPAQAMQTTQAAPPSPPVKPSTSTTKPPAITESNKQRSAQHDELADQLDRKSGGGGATRGPSRPGAAPVEAPPPVSAKELDELTRRHRPAMNACLGDTPSLAVVLHLDGGKARFELPSDTPAAVESCLVKLAAAIKPPAAAKAKLDLSLTK